MSTPSRSVWSGQSPRPQSGAHPVASASVASAMPTDASAQSTVNNSTMPSIPTASTQPVPTPSANTVQALPTPNSQPNTPPSPQPASPSLAQSSSSTQPASTPPPQTSFQPRTPLHRPTDDIILQPSSPSKPKNNKKPLIIGAIALAGAAAVAGLIFLMTGALRGSAPVEAADVKGKFNIYANYLLFGTDSKDSIPEAYDPDVLYKFSAVLDGEYDTNTLEGLDDEIDNQSSLNEKSTIESAEYPGYSEASAEYFNNTKDLFYDFYNQYQSENNQLDDTIVEYKQYLDFFYIYLARNSYSNLDDFYQAITDLNSDTGNEYINYGKSISDLDNQISEIYNSVGCQYDNDDDSYDFEACINNAEFSEEQASSLENLENSINQNTQAMSDLIATVSENIIVDCWNIEDGLQNGA